MQIYVINMAYQVHKPTKKGLTTPKQYSLIYLTQNRTELSLPDCVILSHFDKSRYFYQLNQHRNNPANIKHRIVLKKTLLKTSKIREESENPRGNLGSRQHIILYKVRRCNSIMFFEALPEITHTINTHFESHF